METNSQYLQKISQHFCHNYESHSDNQLGIACVDIGCPIENQLQLMCMECVDEPYHQKDNHIHKSLKFIIKSIQSQLPQQEVKQEQQASDIELQMKEEALYIAKEFKIMGHQLEMISNHIQNIFYKDQQGDDIHQSLQNLGNSQNSQELQSQMQNLKKFISIDEKGNVTLKQNDDQQNQAIQQYLEKIKGYKDTCQLFMKKMYDDIQIIDGNMENLQKQNQDIKQNQEYLNLEQLYHTTQQQLDRLTMEKKDMYDTCQIWKQKYKQLQSSNIQEGQQQKQNEDLLETQNNQLKQNIYEFKSLVKDLKEQNEKLKLKYIADTQILKAKIVQQVEQLEKFQKAYREQKQKNIQLNQQKQEPSKNLCKKGHNLTKVSLLDPKISGLTCDECQRSCVQRMVPSNRCNICDYDICETCFQRKNINLEHIECNQQ